MSVQLDDSRPNDAVYDEILSEIQRPSRYIGGEWNQIVKDHRSVDVTFALGFPDVYEIGMSHLGYRILYSLLNSREDTVAERVCCPWPDMAEALRRHKRPLGSLETRTPLAEFDIIGFSLQYEMTFTNVLEMLDLAGVPLRAADRGDGDPLVAVGGPVVFNVEPLADFVDLVFVGDGEELVPEFLDRFKEWKRSGASRERMLKEAARIEGIYVPSLYRAEADDRSGLLIPSPVDDAPMPVLRRIAMDLDRHPFPDRIIVPHGEIVHDRVSVEVMRGCPVGCRFCQAGYIYRPTRERDPNQVRDTVIRSVRATGYDQFSLSSLNTGEYGSIQPVMFDLMDRFAPEKVSISLSSMHASTITPELAEQIRRVRKSGFTIAPEAGTQRLRDVINKNLSEEQILEACRLAFEAGWDHIKLYFMIGLPTETDSDVDGLVDLAHEIMTIGRGIRGKTRKPLVTLSASSFIPKPETPFQWVGMDRIENLYRKQDRIAARVRRGVRFKHHRCETSFLEGVFSRGDRALGNVIERAWRNGARFDGWDEHLNRRAWDEAFRAEGVDPEHYAYSDLDPDQPLPWHVVHSRVNRKWLALELRRAMQAGTLTVCGPTDCHGCAPFARECVKGVVAETTDRLLASDVPLLTTPFAPGPGMPIGLEAAPRMPSEATLVVDDVAPRRPQSDERPVYRYRARFNKFGALRFIGHLDLSRLILRSLRRAGLELVYSQGFNPKPKVGFGPALAVGISSDSEYVDFDTYRRLDDASGASLINGALPDGLRFDLVREIPRSAASLGDAIRAARYRVTVRAPDSLAETVATFRGRQPIEIRRQKKNGKTQSFDLADELLALEVTDDSTFGMTLAMRHDGASVRPEEVLREIFGESRPSMDVVREDLLVDWKGRLVNPLLAASASSPGP
jgi:radical SAM family uncharacterized protein/radical SAM-linked protein